MIKKKKKGKSYSDQVKPKSKSKLKTPKLKSSSNNVKDARKEKGKELMRKLIGEPKNTKAEKVVGKKTKAKPMGTAAKRAAGKKALKKIPKKSDKRIQGSGAMAAKGKKFGGQKEKEFTQRIGTTGQSMGAARKTQMRRTAPSKLSKQTGADGLSLKMKREYQDISPARRTRLMAIINTGDKERIRKAFSQVDISVSDFLKVRKVFRGG